MTIEELLAKADRCKPIERAAFVATYAETFLELARSFPRWVPVSDKSRSPKDGADVLITDGDYVADADVEYADDGSGRVMFWRSGEFIATPTHWMPFPPAPQPPPAPAGSCWLCRGEHGGDSAERERCPVHGRVEAHNS